MAAGDAPPHLALYSHYHRQRQPSMSDGMGMAIHPQAHPLRPQHGVRGASDGNGCPPPPADMGVDVNGKRQDTTATAVKAKGMKGEDDEMREFGGPLVREGRQGKHSF